MSDSTLNPHSHQDTYHVPKETEQSEDKPKRPGMTLVTEQIISLGRDGIRRRLIRRRQAVIESSENEEG